MRIMSRAKQKLINLMSPVYTLDKRLKHLTTCAIQENLQPGSNWLDVGCGMKPYQELFKNMNYVGVDVYESGRPDEMKVPDFYFNGEDLPFDDSTFDGVLCTQVLEHVINPSQLLNEIHRILLPGSKVIISVPFIYREHELPFDFRRFTVRGLECELIKSGFRTLYSVKCLDGIASAFMLLSLDVNKKVQSKGRLTRIIFGVAVILPLNLLMDRMKKRTPDDSEIYSAFVIVGEKDY